MSLPTDHAGRFLGNAYSYMKKRQIMVTECISHTQSTELQLSTEFRLSYFLLSFIVRSDLLLFFFLLFFYFNFLMKALGAIGEVTSEI